MRNVFGKQFRHSCDSFFFQILIRYFAIYHSTQNEIYYNVNLGESGNDGKGGFGGAGASNGRNFHVKTYYVCHLNKKTLFVQNSY